MYRYIYTFIMVSKWWCSDRFDWCLQIASTNRLSFERDFGEIGTIAMAFSLVPSPHAFLSLHCFCSIFFRFSMSAWWVRWRPDSYFLLPLADGAEASSCCYCCKCLRFFLESESKKTHGKRLSVEREHEVAKIFCRWNWILSGEKNVLFSLTQSVGRSVERALIDSSFLAAIINRRRLCRCWCQWVFLFHTNSKQTTNYKIPFFFALLPFSCSLKIKGKHSKCSFNGY